MICEYDTQVRQIKFIKEMWSVHNTQSMKHLHNVTRQNLKTISEYLHNARRQNLKSTNHYNKILWYSS